MKNRIAGLSRWYIKAQSPSNLVHKAQGLPAKTGYQKHGMKHCISICAFLLLLVFPAGATTLTERDLFTSGDKLITYDPVTGLEWLDITATTGLSFVETQATPFYTDLGFTHASIEQIQTFLFDAGVVAINPVRDLRFPIFDTRDAMLADPQVQNVLEYFRMTDTT